MNICVWTSSLGGSFCRRSMLLLRLEWREFDTGLLQSSATQAPSMHSVNGRLIVLEHCINRIIVKHISCVMLFRGARQNQRYTSWMDVSKVWKLALVVVVFLGGWQSGSKALVEYYLTPWSCSHLGVAIWCCRGRRSCWIDKEESRQSRNQPDMRSFTHWSLSIIVLLSPTWPWNQAGNGIGYNLT